MGDKWENYDTGEHVDVVQSYFAVYRIKMVMMGGVAAMREEEAAWKQGDALVHSLSIDELAEYADLVSKSLCRDVLEFSPRCNSMLLSAACSVIKVVKQKSRTHAGSRAIGNIAILLQTLQKLLPHHIVTAELAGAYKRVLRDN